MTTPPDKPRRLGRGLEALLASRPLIAPTVAPPAAPPAATAAPNADAPADIASTTAPGTPASATAAAADAPLQTPGLRAIPISRIRPNPFQPRKEFAPQELADLEASLKASGLLQPITVRSAPNDSFEIIAGERRLRAAANAGWTTIPAIVREIDDRTTATLAMVENLQRADLNPIEEAEGYQRLIAEFDLTQQQVADVVGKDRSTVANMLRVLNLPAAARRLLQEGQLSLGHARALLALGDEHRIIALARETVTHGLSVRDVEKRARDSAPASGTAKGRAGQGNDGTAGDARRPRDPEARRIEDRLRRFLQTDVHLSVTKDQKGEIRIHFYSNDDLARVLDLLLTTEDSQ